LSSLEIRLLIRFYYWTNDQSGSVYISWQWSNAIIMLLFH